MGSLFSNKQQTNQSGTTNSTTSNNLWDNPQLQQFLQGYNQQYSGAGNFNVPINGYQTGAANQQTGVASGLQPAQGVANSIGQSGITPASIQSFMSPYTQNVVDATRADFAKQNANDLSNVQGQAAKLGALTGTGTRGALTQAKESQARTQNPVIAGLYNQGYGQATNTAAQSAGLQLQGAGTAGSLANSATGANSALGNLGQNIWGSQYQNAQAPYSLYNQGIQGYQGFGNLAGNTSSGSSTGTGTTTQTPSLGSIIAGLGGTLLSGFADGGSVDGGRMTPYQGDDGHHHRLVGKMGHAFRAIHDMKRAFGGVVGMPGYDSGGEVPAMEPYGGSSSIPAFMGTDTSSSGMPSYLGAGTISAQPIGPTPSPERTQPQASGMFGNLYGTGVWNGEAPTKMQRFGAALTQIGDGPFKGVGQHILAQQDQRFKELQAERAAAELLGKFRGQPTLQAQHLKQSADIARGEIDGQPTLAGAKNPAEIAALEASSEPAKLRLMEQQRRLEFVKQQQLREQQIQDMVSWKVISPQQAEQMRALNRDSLPSNSAGYDYDPQTGQFKPRGDQ